MISIVSRQQYSSSCLAENLVWGPGCTIGRLPYRQQDPLEGRCFLETGREGEQVPHCTLSTLTSTHFPALSGVEIGTFPGAFLCARASCTLLRFLTNSCGLPTKVAYVLQLSNRTPLNRKTRCCQRQLYEVSTRASLLVGIRSLPGSTGL